MTKRTLLRPLARSLALACLLFAAGAGAETRLVLLGTGTPNADPERSGPAVAVVVDGTAYLVDAGVGVVRRAAAAAEALDLEALEADRLGHVFLTHLHSDHTLGLPDLLLTSWTLGRAEQLEVLGPAGTAAMLTHIEAAWQRDLAMRLYGLEPANTTGYRARVHEIEPGLVFESEGVRVRAIAVPHGSWPQAYAFRFDTPDLSIVISGDTAFSERLIEASADCDILLHEVYSQAGFDRRELEWQRYHGSFHTSTAELAEVAKRVGPRLLVLYHQLYWGSDDEDLVDEIRAGGWAGPLVSGRDLQAFSVGDLEPQAAAP